MKTKSRQLIAITLAAALAGFASIFCASCNTSRGFGKDLQKVGEEIEQEADEHL
ncbi:MAG: entericidin A/B family lipoprotein [Verrucomicrobiales bacterium]